MRKKIAVAAALLAVVVIGAGVAAAHVRRASPEQRAERLVARVTKELALDAGQQAQLKRLAEEFLPVARQLRSVREETRAKIGSQLQAGQFDAEGLKAAAHANLSTLEQATDQFIERLAQFHAQLTPEQKAKVAERFEKLDDWQGRAGAGRQEGRGGHGRPRGRQ